MKRSRWATVAPVSTSGESCADPGDPWRLWQPAVVADLLPPVAPVAPGAPSAAVIRRRWWGPAPEPDLAPISGKRAYTEVLLVYAAFFLSGVLAAALLLAGRYHDPFSNGSWADYSPEA